MSTAQELQTKIDEMSVELDNLREQVIANNARRSGIDMSAPLPDDTKYEKALRIAAAESAAREIAQNNERKEWQDIAKSLKDKKNGGQRRIKRSSRRGHKLSGRKLSGHKLSGHKLSQRKQKCSRQSRR